MRRVARAFVAARAAASSLRLRLSYGVYRVSGGRLARSPELYRVHIGEQRRHAGRIPGMTSITERAYFQWHAQEVFTGEGEIVDLGSWFGSTTATLAMGLRRNPRAAARRAHIHAYDRFVWEPWMHDYTAAARLGEYSPGDSFLPEFELTMQPWRSAVEVHAGDLRAEGWAGPPIELLLVDSMKAWDVTAHIVREFYRHLMSGDGYMIHQDFANCYTPWIHLTSHQFKDEFEPVMDVPGSESLVFRVTVGLSTSAERAKVSREDFGERDVDEAFAYSLSITRPEKHSGILGARAMLSVYDGDLDEAQRLLDAYCAGRRLSPMHERAVREAIMRTGQEAHEPA